MSGRRRRARRTAWVLVLALDAGLLGWALGLRLTAQATAETAILLAPLTGNAFSDHSGNLLVDLETESHLPQSDGVLTRVVAAEEGAGTPEALRRSLSATIVPNSSVIVVRYRAEDPAQARAVVERVASATLEERLARREVVGDEQLTILSAQQAALDEQSARLTGGGLSPEVVRVLSQRQATIDQARAAVAATPGSAGQVISTTVRPDSRVQKIRIALIVIAVGLGVLAGLWVSRDRRDAPEGGLRPGDRE